jgi:hypothetical protein
MNKITTATLDDVTIVANLLMAMYTEMEPDLSSTMFKDYLNLASKHLKEDDVYLYEDKALFIVKDVSSPVINRQMWDGASVYIKPEYRNGRILKKLYSHMFKTYSGVIVGFVEPNSKHLPVVSKRNKLLGYVYEIMHR